MSEQDNEPPSEQTPPEHDAGFQTLLFDELFYRLLRTGAYIEAYTSEEDGDVDVSVIDLHVLQNVCKHSCDIVYSFVCIDCNLQPFCA